MDSSTISDTPVEIPATTSPVKKPKRKTRVGHQHFFVDKVEELTSKNQLTSGYINMAQMMMKKNNPDIGGLFCVTIGGSLEFPKVDEEKWMQIIHTGRITGYWRLKASASLHMFLFMTASLEKINIHILLAAHLPFYKQKKRK